MIIHVTNIVIGLGMIAHCTYILLSNSDQQMFEFHQSVVYIRPFLTLVEAGVGEVGVGEGAVEGEEGHLQEVEPGLVEGAGLERPEGAGHQAQLEEAGHWNL